jgi:hypothetical protein
VLKQELSKSNLVSQDMIPFYERALEKTAGNIDSMIDFILASVNEKNISLGSKRIYIDILSKFLFIKTTNLSKRRQGTEFSSISCITYEEIVHCLMISHVTSLYDIGTV